MMEGVGSSSSSSWSAYGSGGSTGSGFDVVAFLKKPQVILRIVSWVFSIIVFSCIAGGAYIGDGVCAYGEKSNCGYGTAVGVLAFIGLLVFLVLDAVFDNLSNVEHRKYIVMGDVAFSGLWSFLWFICFCLLTNKWTTNEHQALFKNKSSIEAAIAFSFFSIGTFVAITVLAAIRYRKGVVDEFPPEYDPNAFGGNAPYSGGTEQGSTPYQAGGGGEFGQSPFTSPDPKPLPGGYQQQTY